MSKHRYHCIDFQAVEWPSVMARMSGERVVFSVDVAKHDMVAAVLDPAVPAAPTGVVMLRWRHPQQTRAVVAQLQALGRVKPVEVVLEPSGTYGDALVGQVRAAGLAVYRLSPKRVHDAAEVYDGVPSLHDAKAAALIGQLHGQGLSQRWEAPPYVSLSVASRYAYSVQRAQVINDSCGHAAGDELLRQLGSMLSDHVRTRDMAARLGGDEFGVVLEHCSLKQAQHIGEALCQAIEAFVFVWEKQVFRIAASISLDRWVVRAAIDWLTAQPERLEHLTFCNINLSAHSIVDETFLEFVLDHFKKNPATPHKICFEITETAAIANIARANRFIKTLKQLGCRFALDDFGSGLASFAHLKTLPVDFLKIAGAFVRGIVEDPIDLAMVKCINTMAQATGKQTIAEFVENAAILQKLREIGVDCAQGYAIGRPQPLACDASII